MATLGEYIGAGSGTTKGLYHFNGNLNDSSGNNKTLSQTGTVSDIFGKFGGGKSADWQTTNMLSVDNFLGSALGTGNITMICWFRKNGASTQNYTPTILSLGRNQPVEIPNTRIYMVADKTTGYASFFSFDGASTNVSSTKNICDNIWHCVIGVRSGTTMNIYVDGSLGGTTTDTARNINYDNLRIGNVGDTTYDELGQADIDEVRIDPRAWSASEVKKYYTFSKGRFGII